MSTSWYQGYDPEQAAEDWMSRMIRKAGEADPPSTAPGYVQGTVPDSTLYLMDFDTAAEQQQTEYQAWVLLEDFERALAARDAVIAAKDARIAELDSELAAFRAQNVAPLEPKSEAPAHNPFREFPTDRRRMGGY